MTWNERRERAARAVREGRAEWILTSADAVCYASGHVASIEADVSPFAGGPTIAFLTADGTLVVVAANVEAATGGAVES